jgi:hypothetical protein
MDEIVKQAMAKWPNVPHCFGWLALDARGQWRMRDETAQERNLPGERIRHPALLAFIDRNYGSDDQGRWFFQNGPQRVYVDLAIAPWIVHTDPERGLVQQTGAAVETMDAAWMTEDGQLLFSTGAGLALLDDRDLASCMQHFRLDDRVAGDEALIAWLAGGESRARDLRYLFGGTAVPVGHVARRSLESRFGFVARPRAPALPEA